MGVEVVGFEMVEGPVENGVEDDKSVSEENGVEDDKSVSKENGVKEDKSVSKENVAEEDAGVVEEPIKIGAHGDESAEAEGIAVSGSNAPQNALEEWPAPKQIHSFYFVRFRPYDDPNIKAKIDKLDKEINQKNQVRITVTDELRAKRSERSELISQIKSLRDENRQFQSIVDEKIKEIEPLQQALGKLRTTNNAGRGGGLCSSEEELNNLINSLQYRIQHESIPLTEEKQILREIKQLEGTREKVIANVAMRAKVQDSMGQKETIQDQVKVIGGDLDEVKKERQAIRSKIKQLDDAVKALDMDILSLQDKLGTVTEAREKAYESIQQLRKQRDHGNTDFYQSRTILNKARELAAMKDIDALEEFTETEVEKVMSLWNRDKSFRNDYEKRLLSSLDMRQLSRDGRMRNPDEKPLLEEPKPAETDTLLSSKSNVKQPKEEPKLSPLEIVPAQKLQNETKKKGKDMKSKLDNNDLEDADEYEFELPKETPKEPPIDPMKLKEMKREEEIAKAKQALERKKKQAEKAAAKAAMRAQKEAEKKLKEREKKAKKAAGGSGAVPNPDEPENEVEEVTVLKANDNIEASAPVKEKAQKENNVRSRGRVKALKSPESVPKAILKRKRSNTYLIWIVCGALLALAVVGLGYILFT